MITTRVFQNGNSQAVSIPREFQFDVTEVEIFRRGDELILRKKKENLLPVLDIFAAMPDDFMEEDRNDPPPVSKELYSKSWDGFMEDCEELSEDFDIGRDELPEDSERRNFD